MTCLGRADGRHTKPPCANALSIAVCADVTEARDQSAREEHKVNVSMGQVRDHYGRSCLKLSNLNGSYDVDDSLTGSVHWDLL